MKATVVNKKALVGNGAVGCVERMGPDVEITARAPLQVEFALESGLVWLAGARSSWGRRAWSAGNPTGPPRGEPAPPSMQRPNPGWWPFFGRIQVIRHWGQAGAVPLAGAQRALGSGWPKFILSQLLQVYRVMQNRPGIRIWGRDCCFLLAGGQNGDIRIRRNIFGCDFGHPMSHFPHR
jgi:hypothetical protein